MNKFEKEYVIQLNKSVEYWQTQALNLVQADIKILKFSLYSILAGLTGFFLGLISSVLI